MSQQLNSGPADAPMDPQTKSLLTSIVLSLASAAAMWAANKGLIPSADVPTIANDLMFLVFAGVAVATGWYKRNQHTQTAQITAVNDADNGRKVVDESSPSKQVDAPRPVASK